MLMLRRTALASLLACTALMSPVSFAADAALAKALYKDAAQPVDARVKDLLSKMTLEEKVAQLQTVWIKRQQLETNGGEFTETKAESILGKGIGQVARPAENKGGNGKIPSQTAAFTNDIQQWLKEETRLGIPTMFHEEALHGHAGRNATSFPQAIGMASTWDPQLVHDMYALAAKELRSIGVHQALTPILDVARDPRWGRIEETMGEDPYLIAALGVAGVKGFQDSSDGKIGKNGVIATLKHLAGHGQPEGGQNTAPAAVTDRVMKEVFLFPFEAVVKEAHPRSVMASYNEIDGIPSHSNVDLLQKTLRDDWGFDGVIVSDYFAIPELAGRHHLTDSKAEAARLALIAGVDVETPDGDTYPNLIKLVKEGKLPEAAVDVSVARVLREKFMLGLFDNATVDTKTVDDFVGNDQHRALALKAAEKAMVLLKNDGNILPLTASKLKTVAVIGPHADETLLGGYSDVPKQTVSVLQGIRDYLGKNVKVLSEQGTLITVDSGSMTPAEEQANSRSKRRWNSDKVELATQDDTKGMIEKAVAAAKKSDVAIVVIGDNEATSREAWAEQHMGDRTSLDLLGEQQALVDAVLATGKPTVVLLIGGRPLAITKLAEKAPAIIQGWYLGQETGRAVARVLFGDVNPSGKLPVSVPRSVGQLPVFYNHKPTAKRGYLGDDNKPLYPFGYGMSYTSFDYKDLKLSKPSIKAGEAVDISMTVTNTGSRAGDEIVQLYINDVVATVTQPVKVLKGFQRVSLAPKASARVTFTLAANQLGLYDRQMKYVLEPGAIKLMVGRSSADIELDDTLQITGDVVDIAKSKVYLTPVKVAQP
jgi:beta-glucosidase